MNKLHATILLALVACVAAGSIPESQDQDLLPGEEESQLQVIPDDDEEVRFLNEENQIFGSYCIEARDQVKFYMKSSANGVAARIFNVLLNNAQEIGLESAQAGMVELVNSAAQARQGIVSTFDKTPDVLPVDVERGVEESLSLDEKIAEQERKTPGFVKILVQAGKSFAETIARALYSKVAERLILLRDQINVENFSGQVLAACADVSQSLKPDLERKFGDTKRSLVAGADKQFAAAISRVRIENVGCVTSGRIVKTAQFCDLLRLAAPTLFPMLGL